MLETSSMFYKRNVRITIDYIRLTWANTLGLRANPFESAQVLWITTDISSVFQKKKSKWVRWGLWNYVRKSSQEVFFQYFFPAFRISWKFVQKFGWLQVDVIYQFASLHKCCCLRWAVQTKFELATATGPLRACAGACGPAHYSVLASPRRKHRLLCKHVLSHICWLDYPRISCYHVLLKLDALSN